MRLLNLEQCRDKAGRKPLYAYIEEHWKVDMGDDDSKASFKTAMEKRIEEGIIVQARFLLPCPPKALSTDTPSAEQDKQSFHFSPKGRKYYNENYES
ncbi:hypothetical protein JCM10213_003845 [Rhodosporidiobolus nylandii]